jgi:hypothetical protein
MQLLAPPGRASWPGSWRASVCVGAVPSGHPRAPWLVFHRTCGANPERRCEALLVALTDRIGENTPKVRDAAMAAMLSVRLAMQTRGGGRLVHVAQPLPPPPPLRSSV